MSVATTAPVEPTAPAPAPTRIHLLPVPQYEPPYDDELTADQVPPVAGSMPLPFERPTARRLRLVADPEPTTRDLFSPERTPRAELPDPRRWGGRLAQALAEVADGSRPIGQLLRWVSEDVSEEIEAQCHRSTAQARRTGSPAGRPLRRSRTVVKSVHVCEPDDGIAELSATVRRDGRVTAVALRLEGLDGRWLCTALQQ